MKSVFRYQIKVYQRKVIFRQERRKNHFREIHERDNFVVHGRDRPLSRAASAERPITRAERLITRAELTWPVRSRDTCGSCTVSRARETCGLLSFPLVPLVESTASWVQETCSLPSFASSFWLLLRLCFHARCYSPSFLSIPDVVGLDMILSHGARFSLDDNRSVILNLSRL